MEFNDNEEEQEQEEQEEQEVVGIQQQQQPQPQPPVHLNFEPVVKKPGGGGYRFKECLKNHAVSIGGQAVDGCGEFMPTGDEGTLEALKCAACSCHRNFHRKETDHHHQQGPLTFPLPLQQTYYHHHNNNTHQPRGYLQLKPPPPPRTLALPSSCREDLDDISNPSSSGGGGGGGLRKRFRTKFTAEQKDRMLEISEALGWRIQKQDESVVQRFCAETGVKRHVLKVWMHNNKHMVGKKP